MQKLRSLHLYLGCIFAPLLLFFAMTGICQILRLHFAFFGSDFFLRLSSIHTERALKNDAQLGSTPLQALVIIMAVSFVVTTILGVIMALKFGRSRKSAVYCLVMGVLIPSVLVLLRMLG